MQAIQRLLHIMQRLRDPVTGCPWDREQTFHSIVPHTLEEAYEVADAIEQGDMAEVRDELGDLLFQVVFYAQLGQEQGLFDFEAIATAIADKLERRHPHVFAQAQVANADEQTRHWETLKAEERAGKADKSSPASVLDGVTRSLPALNVAHKLQKRAALVGFDWPDQQGVLDKLQEEIAEVQQAWPDPVALQEEIGDLLFTCVNLARHAGVDSETALRQANHKFEQRFRQVESNLAATDTPLGKADIATMESAWCKAKGQPAGKKPKIAP